MNDDHLTPEEQRLTQHLRRMPRHTLRASARAAIREQMMSEYRTQGDETTWQPVVHQNQTRALFRTVGLVAAVGLVVALLFVQNANRQSATTSTSVPPTELQALTLVPSTTATIAPTLEPSATPVAPTLEMSATPANQELIQATPLPFTLVPAETLVLTPPMPTTQNSSSVVVVEGPVTSIVNNRITVYSFEVELPPQDPILSTLAVDDTVHVEGSLAPSGVVIASTTGRFVNPPSADDVLAAPTLKGRVESINGNQLVVNGVVLRLAPGDPILQQLKVGDEVQIWGTYEAESGVLVALHMMIVLPPVVINSAPAANTNNNPPPDNSNNGPSGNNNPPGPPNNGNHGPGGPNGNGPGGNHGNHGNGGGEDEDDGKGKGGKHGD